MSNILLTYLNICLIFKLYIVINIIIKKGSKIMIINQAIFKTLAIASLTFITSGTVFAHSNDDNSAVPFKWQFLENLHSKIERNLSSTNSREVFGLNTFEQKKIKHYGNEVGNKLSSTVENIDVIFEKTSTGLKITVERTSGGLIFLKYMNQENLEKENLNKGTVEGNI
jgi:hypothetical protein